MWRERGCEKRIVPFTVEYLLLYLKKLYVDKCHFFVNKIS